MDGPHNYGFLEPLGPGSPHCTSPGAPPTLFFASEKMTFRIGPGGLPGGPGGPGAGRGASQGAPGALFGRVLGTCFPGVKTKNSPETTQIRSNNSQKLAGYGEKHGESDFEGPGARKGPKRAQNSPFGGPGESPFFHSFGGSIIMGPWNRSYLALKGPVGTSNSCGGQVERLLLPGEPPPPEAPWSPRGTPWGPRGTPWGPRGVPLGGPPLGGSPPADDTLAASPW